MFTLPKTSRGWQFTQHLVGGSYQILLMVTGVSFGQKDWDTAIILGIITFILNRISSQITYEIQMHLIQEHSRRT